MLATSSPSTRRAIQEKFAKPLVLVATENCKRGCTLWFDHWYLRVVSHSLSHQAGQAIHTSFNALLSIMHIYSYWMYQWRTASLPARCPCETLIEELVSQRGCDATATSPIFGPGSWMSSGDGKKDDCSCTFNECLGSLLIRRLSLRSAFSACIRSCSFVSDRTCPWAMYKTPTLVLSKDFLMIEPPLRSSGSPY